MNLLWYWIQNFQRKRCRDIMLYTFYIRFGLLLLGKRQIGHHFWTYVKWNEVYSFGTIYLILTSITTNTYFQLSAIKNDLTPRCSKNIFTSVRKTGFAKLCHTVVSIRRNLRYFLRNVELPETVVNSLFATQLVFDVWN